MRKEIVALRKVMEEKGIDAWISPSTDAHQSEYPTEYDKCRRFLSGFSGSAGTLLVLKETAYLWTDGRYFLQAKKELESSGIILMKQGEAGVPELEDFLSENMKKGEVLGFYGDLVDARTGKRLATKLIKKDITFKIGEDLTSYIWTDRPKRSAEKIWIHPLSYAGRSFMEKVSDVRVRMQGADILLTSALSDIAWLTNLRGGDISCNPLFLSYFVLGKENAILFVQEEALTKEVCTYLEENHIEVRAYDTFHTFLSSIEKSTILYDEMATGYRSVVLLSDKIRENKLISNLHPVTYLKNIKNTTEISHMQASHIRDGAYMAKFAYWLEKELEAGHRHTEKTASDYLDNLRLSDEKSVGLSFPTIAGYAANGAIVHYEADEESAKVLERKGLFLFDSGGHYLDGTTDVTRTVALGEVSTEEKMHYTLVVIGMLRLLNTVFKRGSRGISLDIKAREMLWKYGIDYNHGTGHGVGFLNTVHEAPANIRPKPGIDPKRDVEFVEGMVISDEPGVYITGSHGVRMEILVFVKEYTRDFLCFESLTYAPIDPAPLDMSLMSAEDKAYYDAYQAQVYEKISPLLNEEECAWLERQTRRIS